ncbi:hypothetical protein SAMD00023353_0403740 [Rosellinia necatrix]|uniref:Peptidase S8/S53 domain-containing protein n=1 Tax=Rosellinia necatrix TaxID=77044 RepID=A0A1W2TWB7_ROSNE|nr:hypothetical protein SAMD00023353_0403740 [Rosellinia necatrix]
MGGADAEADALSTYYTAVDAAKELVRDNLRDQGMEKWSCALGRVGPHIPAEKLSRFRSEFMAFRVTTLGNDTSSDSGEPSNNIQDSDNEADSDGSDIDRVAIMRMHEAEFGKLGKSNTMRPQKNLRGPPSRSSTIQTLKRSRTEQIPYIRNDDLSYTSRRNADRAATPPEGTWTRGAAAMSKPRTIPEPTTTSPTFNKLNNSRLHQNEDQATRNSAQPHPSTAPGVPASHKENDWFASLESTAHKFVYGEKRDFWPKQPVKVAILDSGFALTGAAREAMKPYSSRVRKKETFTEEFDLKNPQERLKALDDPSGHGTTVAYQVMKTCPSAHVYIAKVTIAGRDGRKAVPDKEAVARAIRHAATSTAKGGWGVDVINMSFGWSESELPRRNTVAEEASAITEGISAAIDFADKQGVLLFAAASNYGLTERNEVFYPARDHRVISVDAEDGRGNPASFAIREVRGDGGVRYCAPGLGIKSPIKAEPMCGSSFACPVAAGVAALVLEFARHESVSLSKSESVQSALLDARGMLKVFGLMSQQAANNPGFKMLYPWHFLGHEIRGKVELDIIGQLRIEFGEKLGKEIKHSVTWGAA